MMNKNEDIDNILIDAFKKFNLKSKLKSYFPIVAITILVITLLWTCTKGPLNSNYSNINHGDKVKIVSGDYRGVMGKANLGTCPITWHIYVVDYCCKAWWDLEKVD